MPYDPYFLGFKFLLITNKKKFFCCSLLKQPDKYEKLRKSLYFIQFYSKKMKIRTRT